MSITFKILKHGSLLASLVRRNSKFKQNVRTNFILAGEQFITEIRSRWYEGRNSDDTGLNQRTRDLWKGWIADVRDDGIDVVAVIINKLDYGLKHETGKEEVPKRTFVTEDMQGEIGSNIFKNAVKKALKANF